MKKYLFACVVLIISAVLATNNTFLKRYYHVYFSTNDMFVGADNDSFDRGPDIGTQLPSIRAIYNNKILTNLSELAGSRGTVFVINRSLEWCPFCMRQSIELQHMKEFFDDEGIAIVMMTYDTPVLQQAFIDRHSIEYPVLSDVKAESFANLKILREEYAPGDRHYGLPYPGILIVSPSGVIKGKLFVKAYSNRVDTMVVLDLATQLLTN